MPARVAEITEDQLKNWKLIDHFRKFLLPRLGDLSPHPGLSDPRRQLACDEYFSLFLFGLLNPVLTSMRGLCAATKFKKMRRICRTPVAPASFSEAQSLFSPNVLEGVLKDMALLAQKNPRFGSSEARQAIQCLTVVDGTILRALNRMVWAPAAGFGCAVRVNLEFSVFDQIPLECTITPSRESELKVWKKRCKAGSFYVGDRLYGEDHLWLKQLQKNGTDFVVRLIDRTWIRTVEEPRPLRPEDIKAGIVSDEVAQLGCREGGPKLRVIRVVVPGKELLLATNRMDLPAELIGQIYRYRWEIELFFKWIKTMLPCKHWMAESPEGVAIQIYTVLIASLLLLLWTGQRPSKREMEALRFYLNGFIDEEELEQALRQGRKSK